MQGIPSLILTAVPPLLTKAVYRLEDLWLCCPDCKHHRVLCGNAVGASGVLERRFRTVTEWRLGSRREISGTCRSPVLKVIGSEVLLCNPERSFKRGRAES
jgi:hypothetical protein